MATACSNSCDICMHDFNKANRKSVALPCGHDFCLTCLVRLKTSGNHKCPKCRGDWAEVQVKALPGMDDVEKKAGARQMDEGELGMKVKKKGDLCLNHQFPYLYWCVDENEFHCKKCIVDKRCVQLELIDEAIPLIRTDLRRRVTEKLAHFQTDLGEMKKIKNEVSGELRATKKYKEVVQKVEDDLQGIVSKIELLMAENRKSSRLVKGIQGKIIEVKSQFDVPFVMKSRTTLEALAKPTAVPNVDNSQALLCNIAKTYMEVAELRRPSQEIAFMCGMLLASEISIGPLTEVVRAAEKLNWSLQWTVDSSNYLAALLALADGQPAYFTMIARPNEPETLPVAAIAKTAKDCDVCVRFLDSYYLPQDLRRDVKRLDHLLNNSSLNISEFYGHLDASGIARLPRTIDELGLAIGSAADAMAVSSLRPWDGLDKLAVSVSCGVAAQDLRPLPSVSLTSLSFPGLTNARLVNVRPAIDALVPSRKLHSLNFPSSYLTAYGAHRLARLLGGVEIGSITLKTTVPWRSQTKMRRKVRAEFVSAVECTMNL